MMEANPDKFQIMLLSKQKNIPDFKLEVNGNILSGESHVKLLRVDIDQNMNFNYHVENLCTKAGRQLGALGRIRHVLDDESKSSITRSFII